MEYSLIKPQWETLLHSEFHVTELQFPAQKLLIKLQTLFTSVKFEPSIAHGYLHRHTYSINDDNHFHYIKNQLGRTLAHALIIRNIKILIVTKLWYKFRRLKSMKILIYKLNKVKQLESRCLASYAIYNSSPIEIYSSVNIYYLHSFCY